MDIVMQIIGYAATYAIGFICVIFGGLGQSVPVYLMGFALMFGAPAYGTYALSGSIIAGTVVGAIALFAGYKFLFGDMGK